MSHQAPQPNDGPNHPGNPYEQGSQGYPHQGNGQSGYPQGYPQPGYSQGGYGQPPQRQGNGFGVAALVIGIIALLLSWIPFINIGAIVLGAIAVILGILGLRRKFVGKGMSIAGIVLGALAIIASAIILIATAALVGVVQDEVERVESQSFTVEFIATTDSGGTATYGVGSDMETVVVTDQWSEEATVTGLKVATVSVSAPTGAATGGQYSCEIRVDGRTVSEDTSSSQASCSATTVD